MSAVGFDVGNEKSCIAVVKSGGIEILDNDYNQRWTPTYIGFTDRCRDIGFAAKSKLITNLESSVFGFKKILGRRLGDAEIHKELTYLPLEYCSLPSGNFGIKVKYLDNICTFSIEQLMAMIFTKLKSITESKLGNKIHDCVIAVPVYYTDAQRRAMLDAVNVAGLQAIKLINESTAVTLLYGFFKQNLTDEEFQNVIFVDLGKSCLTVTACVFTKDKAKILGCVWENVGGRDFDNKLVQYFVEDFKNRYNINAMTSKKALTRLLLECEELKKYMSMNKLEVPLQIECFMNDFDVSGKMNREMFEKLSEQVLETIEMTFLRLLEKTRLKVSDIHSVEIVGGASRMPAVKELIKKTFGCKPSETLNQDEAVARGCALQCAILSPALRTRNYILHDIPSYIIRITWKNKESKEETFELFSFSDKMPSSKSLKISMGKPFLIQAYYVDLQEKLRNIGNFIFENIPEDTEKDGFMKVRMKVCLDIHGIFNIESPKMLKKIEGNELKNNKGHSVENANIDTPEINEKDESPEQLVEEVQISCVVKPHDLAVRPEVPGLTKLRLNEFIDAEQQMICKDIEEKENADARNVLEEFIYDFKGKLNEELKEFVSVEKKISLLQNFNTIEEWLEENDGLEAAEYVKKFKDLRSLSDPIFLKFNEWQQRQSVIDEYHVALKEGYDAFDNLKSNKPTEEEMQSLLKILEESKLQLNQYIEKLSQFRKVDDIPVTVTELESFLSDFKAKFQNSFSEIQNKLKDEQKISDSSGDGRNEISQNSDSSNLPK